MHILHILDLHILSDGLNKPKILSRNGSSNGFKQYGKAEHILGGVEMRVGIREMQVNQVKYFRMCTFSG